MSSVAVIAKLPVRCRPATEPGLVFEDGAGPYGPYATAIAEMVRTPGADIVDDFIRVRARVAQLTEGRQLPWNVSALGAPVISRC